MKPSYHCLKTKIFVVLKFELTWMDGRSNQIHVILVGGIVNAKETHEVYDVVNIPVGILGGLGLELLVRHVC